MKYPSLVLLLLVFKFVFVSCEPPQEPCEPCQTLPSEFHDAYFRVLYEGLIESKLVLYDAVNGGSTQFLLCNDVVSDEVEHNKIIKASGYYKESCEGTSSKLVEITDFEVVHTCLPDIQRVAGGQTLFNKWSVHYIESEDTLLYPPCEGESFIRFYQDSDIFGGWLSYYDFVGALALQGDTAIKIHGVQRITLFCCGTEEQIAFEELFLRAMDENSVMLYSIDDNFLTLVNGSNDHTIKLFLAP